MKSDELFLSGVDTHQKKDTLISSKIIDQIYLFLGGAIYGNSKDQPKHDYGAFSLKKSPLVLICRKDLSMDLTGVLFAILQQKMPITFSFNVMLLLNYGLFSPNLYR